MRSDPAKLKSEAAALLVALAGKSLSPRDRLAIPPQEMPVQDPRERIGNMNEVALGYSAEQAQVEALRCLACANAPCVKGCPVGIDIPRFLKKAATGDFAAALGVIREASLLPAVCGRVCPQESQCQAPCTLGKSLKSVEKAVSIGRVERFVADLERAGTGSKSDPPSAAPPERKSPSSVPAPQG
jgi:glutamate synthase (NADPH/NADH) small chain